MNRVHYKEIIDSCKFYKEENLIYYKPKESSSKWVKSLFEECSHLTKYYIFHCAQALFKDTPLEEYMLSDPSTLCEWAREIPNDALGYYLKKSIKENPSCDNLDQLIRRAFFLYLNICIDRINFSIKKAPKKEVECF